MLAPTRTGRGRGLSLLLAALLAAGCGGEDDGGGAAAPPPAGAVSAATPEAAAAGVRALALGGNAMDAAVAAALVLGVTEPSESGLGGHAVLLVAPPGGEAAVFHAGDETPLRGGADRPALARPSALAVLGAAWERHGSGALAWRDLVEPAIRVAEEGWSLGRYRHRALVREYPRLLDDSLATALLLNPDRSIPTQGTTVTNPALAATLQALADDGPEALGPRGRLTGVLAQALADRGYADAAGWIGGIRVAVAPPARGSYRGRTVLTAPEPFGGPAVLRALSLLDEAPEGVLEQEGLVRTVWLAEALGWARASGSDIAPFLDAAPPLPVPATDTAAPTAERTTHLSVIDGDGMAVSATLSLGRPFGAGFLAGRLGFFPGVAGDAAAPPPPPDTAEDAGGQGPDGDDGQADSAAPDGGVRWWAAPTVLLREGRAELALGSAGGPRGVSAVVQVIATWLAGGGTLEEAVAAPRLHVDPDPVQRHRAVLEGVFWLDAARGARRALAPFGDSLLRPALTERGIALGEHDEGPIFQDWDPWFGGVHAVALREDGWSAAADPRRDGEGRVVEPADVVEATGRPAPAGDAELSPAEEAARSRPAPGG